MTGHNEFTNSVLSNDSVRVIDSRVCGGAFCFGLSGPRSCGDGLVQGVGDPIDFAEVAARENFEGYMILGDAQNTGGAEIDTDADLRRGLTEQSFVDLKIMPEFGQFGGDDRELG